MKATLRLRVKSLAQIFDSDTSPMEGPHLHPDFTTEIEEQAALAGNADGYQLVIVVPKEDLPFRDELTRVLASHYEHKTLRKTVELVDLRRKGMLMLTIALLTVAGLSLVAEVLSLYFPGRFATLIAGSLVIIGWVTLWSPAETLIYGRFPIRRERKRYQLLAQAEVSLVPKADGS